MEQVPWNEDEWGALTEGDQPPQVPYDPWGQNPDLGKEWDYISYRLGKMGLGALPSPLAVLLSLGAPDPEAPTERTRTVGQAMDYLSFLPGLGQVLSAGKQVLSIPSQRYPWSKAPPIGGRSGTGKRAEDILEERIRTGETESRKKLQPIERVLDRLLKPDPPPMPAPMPRSQQHPSWNNPIGQEVPAPPRPAPLSPEEILEQWTKRWRERFGGLPDDDLGGPLPLPPLPGD